MGDQPEWFHPTSGRFVGTTGLLTALTVFVLVVLDPRSEHAVSYAVGAVLGGVLCWAVLLRPRVGLTDDTLVLRQVFRTARVPLVAIEELAVTQVLAVWVDGRRLVSPAIGKPLRRVMRDSRGGQVHLGSDEEAASAQSVPYVDFVEERIRERRSDALRRQASATTDGHVSPDQAVPDAPVSPDKPARVHVEHAWPEIVGTAASGAAFVLSLVF